MGCSNSYRINVASLSFHNLRQFYHEYNCGYTSNCLCCSKSYFLMSQMLRVSKIFCTYNFSIIFLNGNMQLLGLIYKILESLEIKIYYLYLSCIALKIYRYKMYCRLEEMWRQKFRLEMIQIPVTTERKPDLQQCCRSRE